MKLKFERLRNSFIHSFNKYLLRFYSNKYHLGAYYVLSKEFHLNLDIKHLKQNLDIFSVSNDDFKR